ncbi:hypothetical protein [Azoarcus sp. KH32C]|uniref:beta strand repeat-containing protein n=1 Tax=Azoarcus sp. KH32C TaxID=748247 RepID=UPI0002386D6D|nr:hypothetical protein [Azoarcus sp. KH32C]BAL23866.1 hypothetical protein AZKH_1545 [Azoarcus sp. KH32C]
MPKIAVSLSQWADGPSPDLPVATGSQADKWQNGNLGSQQAHYAEDESVPYRAVITDAKEGTLYALTIEWDTTQQGKHALDYLTTWDASFPTSRNETFPSPTLGVSGLLTGSSAFTQAGIVADPRVTAGPDGTPGTADDIVQQPGAFTFFGGVSNVQYVQSLGADGKPGGTGANADTYYTGSGFDPYKLSGQYSGNSSTSVTLVFTYTGDGDANLGETGSIVLAWGGHIAARDDWGSGLSAAAISGSPYHMRLTNFADNDPTTSESVGNQDRSLSSAAVVFPGEIVVSKETTPDGSTQSFNFELTRPSNTVDVVSGQVDVTGDGVIDAKDDGRFTDSGGEIFTVSDGNVTDLAGGDGKLDGFSIVGGKLDITGNGTVDSSDKFTNLAGVGVATFTLQDGQSQTFDKLTDFGSYTVKEVTIPTDWDLTSITGSRTDINNNTTPINITNPTNDQTTITLAEADVFNLTFNDAFVARPSLTIDKSVASITDAGGGNGGTTADEAGDVINYSIVVANTGNVPLTGVSVTDSVEGAAGTAASFVSGDIDNDGQLDTTETWTYSATYTVQQSDLDNNGGGDGDIDNTATVTSDQTAPQSDSASVPLSLIRGLAIDKQFVNVTGGNGNTVSDAVGDVIHYQMLVTNTGNTALDNVQVSDPLLGGTLSGPASGDTDSDGRLDVTETWVYNGSYTVTQADLDGGGNAGSDYDIDNTATASADNTPPASDSEEVPLAITRALAIDKQFVNVTGGNGNTVADAVGDVIHYQMLVTNTGNTALDNVQVSDPLLGGTLSGPASGDTDSDGRLDVTETWVYNGSYTVTQADLDGGGNAGSDYDIDNTATASADNTPPASDSEEVPLAITRALAIDKQFVNVTGGNGNTVADAVGDVIHYQMLVTNTGNTALDNVQVSDPLLGGTLSGPASGDTDSDGRLDVTETWVYNGSYTVTQADLDGGGNAGSDYDIDNTATASADNTLPASDSEEVPLTITRALAIDKQFVNVTGGNGNTVSDAVGDVIHYQMLVTNTGNTALDNVQVSDPLLGGTLSGPASGDTDSDGRLDVTETWVYNGSYTVTQADLDGAGNAGSDLDIDNTATATANDTPPASDSVSVPVVQVRSLDLTKYVSVDGGTTWFDANSPTGPVLLNGSNPMFKYEVANTGNVTLTSLTVVDDNGTPANSADDFSVTLSSGLTDADGDGHVDDLAVGATASGTVTGTFHDGQNTNIAAANGTSLTGGAAPQDTDPANYYGFTPISFQGNPQFNFPNDLEKIQPKLQGGDAFIINPLGYISWDLFTSDASLARIDTTASFLSGYAGLKVSIVEIWNSAGIGSTAAGADAIYRVYVANEGTLDANNDGKPDSVSLVNNTNVVEYDILGLSTNKGLIDLINADPLIGNFNSFSNIENALTANHTGGSAPSNGFLVGNNPALTAGADLVWSSPDVTGTATNEALNPDNPLDGLGGNDAIYGRNNATATNEQINGDAGNDMIEARNGVDTIHGNDGNDWLFGSLGSDTLFGDAGNDVLFGSYGTDVLNGGGGNDTFILRKGDFDTIADFAVGDTIKVWVESLDNNAPTGSHSFNFDETSDVLFVDGLPVAHLLGNPTEANVEAAVALT